MRRIVHLITSLVTTAAIASACGDRPQPVEAPSLTPAAVAADVAPNDALGTDWGPWSEPVNLSAINSTAQDAQPALSPDRLSLYFLSTRPGGLGGQDIWVSRRASVDGPWEPPVNLGPAVNTPFNDNNPSLSQDGHLLFFQSNRPGGHGAVDIYVSRRTKQNDDLDWGAPVDLGGDVNTSQNDAAPMFMPQVAEGPVNFYFVRGPTTTDIDIYSAAITRDGETLGPATPVSELNFAVAGITDARPSVRRDGKEVIFLSNRPGGVGEEDLYVSTRQSVAFPWSAPMNLGPTLNSAFRDASPSLSLDGSTLVFASTRPGGVGDNDLWMSTRQKR